MFEDFIKENEPFAQKENFSKIFVAIAGVFNIVLNDVKLTINNFFPFLSDSEYLEKHRISYSILKFINYTEEDIRNKTTNAYETNYNWGKRKILFEYLNIYFPKRFYINESPTGIERGFILYIQDITDEEFELLTEFLEKFIDPDCFYIINNFTFFPDTSKIGYFKIGYAKIGYTGV